MVEAYLFESSLGASGGQHQDTGSTGIQAVPGYRQYLDTGSIYLKMEGDYLDELREAAGFVLMVREPRPQFLLMQHADRWDLPKGHAEHGEDNLQTALRETEEETGIAATSIQVDPEFRFVTEYKVVGKKRGTYDKRVTYYLGFLKQKPTISTTEHIGHHWWDWPHSGTIQERTIDPLLAALTDFFEKHPKCLHG